ncbi:hypothetical protein CA13_43590 [Planctomycetes bacterium CA13]|uniref:Uncharacterized protein n=1 Tax=Novipirellula herctigrandis TaxID=2527986 RepID=A0A5C5Z767_9BACT|nr:hypothetical protein CA13_43590 [Planctomycetes bacterium CA13]
MTTNFGKKPYLRWVITVGLIFHLLAVIVPPLAFQTRGPLGSSPSVEALITPVRDYSQFLYLDRGYAFFAPDPGPSHLIQAAISDDVGNMTERMIPSLDDQWPRLLYHRHFMLSEFLHEIYEPPGPPPELARIDPIAAHRWEQGRARYEFVRQSIVDHLAHENPGNRVVIRRLEHVLPGFIEMANNPIELDDPRLYRVLRDQSLIPGDVTESAATLPEAIPAPRHTEPDNSNQADQNIEADQSSQAETQPGDPVQ